MISEDFPSKLFNNDNDFSKKIFPLFQPFVNPLDYLVYDEFKWYMVPFMDDNIESLSHLKKETKLKYTVDRLMLAVSLRLNPKFYWNASSSQGLVQLRASISFLSESEDKIFKISHNFDWTDVIDKRSTSSMSNYKSRLHREIVEGIIDND